MLKSHTEELRHFHCIGLVGHPRHTESLATYQLLYDWLDKHHYEVIIDEHVASHLTIPNGKIARLNHIGKHADLVVVIGGDGNMLGTARTLSRYEKKVIGINRGNLGFLTDLDPDNALSQLAQVLDGHYHEEKRFLLEAKVIKPNQTSRKSTALNEIVLHPGKVAHMIDFEVYIDERFAFSQRSDGIIIATPTGSTAYSLSAGGPILTPNLDAIVLVPMFPHSLSSRPLVISSQNRIRIKFLRTNIDYEVSCDSQIMLPIQDDDELLIQRSEKELHLIHPKDYSYFNTLSSKLGWSKKTF